VPENVKNGNLLYRTSAIPQFNEIQSAADSNNHSIKLFDFALSYHRLFAIFIFFGLTILLKSSIIYVLVFTMKIFSRRNRTLAHSRNSLSLHFFCSPTAFSSNLCILHFFPFKITQPFPKKTLDKKTVLMISL